MTDSAAAPDRSSPGGGGRMSPDLRPLVLAALTLCGIYVCYLLTRPFLPALVWALTLAVLFAPLQRLLENRLRRPNLAASICVILASLVVLAAASFVGGRLITEAAKGALLIKGKIESGAWSQALDDHPAIAPAGHWLERNANLPGIASDLASWLTNAGAYFVRGSVVQLTGALITFYMLFYFLRDRRAFLADLQRLLPLSESESRHLFLRVGDTVHATVYGTLAAATVQGTLGGLLFWWLGLPAAFLWGVIMAMLAVIPVLGAFVIWIPAAIYLALAGFWGKALLLAIFGTAVIGTVDNLLYPMLVGNRLKEHTALAFVSIVGGLIVFGASGIVLGPIALTVTKELLAVWHTRNHSIPA